jgi:Ca-activated chloride channel homolog
MTAGKQSAMKKRVLWIAILGFAAAVTVVAAAETALHSVIPNETRDLSSAEGKEHRDSLPVRLAGSAKTAPRNDKAFSFAPFSFSLTAFAAQQAQPQAPASPQPSAQEPPAQLGDQGAIVRSVNLVEVLFSVVNKKQKLITDLTKDDFKVYDDGAQQEISSFSQPTDLPLRIGMVLDTSNSIRERLQFEQDAAIDFLFNALRRGKDQAFLMTFDDGPQMIKDFTGDTGDLRDTILKQRAGGGTSLYDAVYAASVHLLNNSPVPPGPNSDVRRVLVVISDGDDNSSNRSRGESVEMSQRAGVIIYTISTSTEWVSPDEEKDVMKQVQRKYLKTEGDQVLDQLALETGGRSFFPYKVDDLGQSFLDIGDELRHQYALAYSPAGRGPDGKFHNIKIEADRKDVTVRARKGYYYIPPSPPAKPAG